MYVYEYVCIRATIIHEPEKYIHTYIYIPWADGQEAQLTMRKHARFDWQLSYMSLNTYIHAYIQTALLTVRKHARFDWQLSYTSLKNTYTHTHTYRGPMGRRRG